MTYIIKILMQQMDNAFRIVSLLIIKHLLVFQKMIFIINTKLHNILNKIF